MANTITAKYFISADSLTVPILGECESVTLFVINGTNVDISSNKGQYQHTFSSSGTYNITFTLKSSLTDLKNLFNGCTSLISITAFNVDITNVTNLSYLFSGCINLTDIDALSGLDVSGKIIRGLFKDCKSLSDISSLEQWNVTSSQMSELFRGCTSLSDVSPINNWVTTNVSHFDAIFNNCTSLTEIDLSNWNLSSWGTEADWIEGMFEGCTNLITITLPEFPYVYTNMFKDCTSITDIWIRSSVAPKLYVDDTDPFNEIKQAGTLHIPSPNVGYNAAPWTTLVNTYNWTIEEYESNDPYIEVWYSNKGSRQTLIGDCTSVKMAILTKTFGNNTTIETVDLSSNTGSYSNAAYDASIKIYFKDEITSLANLFYGCSTLRKVLNITYDTGNIEDMSYMFANTDLLEEFECINLLNTSNVRDMAHMFSFCGTSNLTLDLSNFNTSKVTDMGYMFYNCGVTDLNLSNFNTSNVTNMERMFCGSKATSLDLSTFDTHNVTDMFGMFQGVTLSETLDLSMLDTSNVTDMGYMFERFNGEVDLTGWKTSNVTDMEGMFKDSTITNSYYKSFNVSKVTNFIRMFQGTLYDEIDLRNWNIGANVDASEYVGIRYMFADCVNLIKIYFPSINSKTSCSSLFSRCYNLDDVQLIVNNEASDLHSAFYYCTSLKNINLKLTKVTSSLDYAFAYTTSLETLDLSQVNIATDRSHTVGVFKNSSVKKIIFGQIKYLGDDMFYDCSNLEEIYCNSEYSPSSNDVTPFTNIRKGGTLYYPINGRNYETYWKTLFDEYEWNKTIAGSVEVSLNVPVEGGTYAIKATNTGTWTVGEHPTWIIPSDTSGTGLSLKVLNNTSLSQRTATVVMTSGDASISINVVQAALEVSWEKTPIVTVDNAGGEFSINLNYNAKPESFELYTKDWVTANYTLYDNYVNIYGTVDPIGGNVYRSDSIYAKLKYAYGEYGTTNSIRQIGSNYTVTPQDINIPETGGSVTITITSDYSLNGYDSASSLYGTTTFNRVSDTEIQVICDIPANTGDARTEVPYLTSTISGFNTIPLTSIIQDAGGTNPDVEWNINTYFEINSTATTPTNQTATLSAQIPYSSSENLGTLEVVFDSNWVKTTDQGWENGEGYITIQAEDNRLGVNRRAVMTLYSPTYNQTREVTIVQSGLEVSIEKEYSVKCSGGDLIIECECNSWIAQNELEMEGVIGTNVLNIPFVVNSGYITTEPSQIIATIPANESTEDRNIKLRLYVTTMDVYYEINVSQPACSLETPVLYFKEKYIKLPLKGGTVYVTLVSNIDWTTKWEI